MAKVKIEVLGVCCHKCEYIYRLIKKLRDENHADADVSFVNDMGKILSHGVMTTPAIIVNGKVECLGRVPSRGEVLHWLGVKQN